MKNSQKIIITAIGIVVVVTSTYFFIRSKPSEEALPTETDVAATSTTGVADQTPAPTAQTSERITVPSQPATASTPAVPVAQNTASASLVVYKGQFFPFEFSYPNNFVPAKNPQASTKDLETKSFNFTRLAFDGGIGGYVSFYVSEGDSATYDDLFQSDPNDYSTVLINGNKFYKYVAKESNESNGYRIEYVTFKDDTEYRFSMIVVNGDRKDLGVGLYQPELDTLESIVKSLKIN